MSRNYGFKDSKDLNSRIYIGNLPPDVRDKDLEQIFHKFGKISYLEVKQNRYKNGTPFAFVGFSDTKDAETAVKSRDGYDLDGYKIKVEFTRGKSYFYDRQNYGYHNYNYNYNYNSYGGGGGRKGGMSGGKGNKRTNYRVNVTGLPLSGSWQDLKDHMREAGDVAYATVYKDGTGIVEFLRYEDMKYAVRTLDDTKFKSHEGESAYIRVTMDESAHNGSGSGRRRGRSGSPGDRGDRGRGRASPSYSPIRNNYSSSSRSRSRSPRSRSRSP